MNNKILDELERTYQDIEKNVQNEEYIKGCKNMYESCRAIIKKHSGESEWIPCSERLPESNDMSVWVSFATPFGGYVKKAYWGWNWKSAKKCFNWQNGKEMKDMPVAWKPYYTPELYKEDN